MTGRDLRWAIMRFLMHSWFRLTRSMTIGVRALVIDEQGRILLIRPRYTPGWILPGGGLERGETALDAVARELKEETGVTLKGVPRLFGIYSHETQFRGDHVILYVVREFERGEFAPTREIKEARFFDPRALPAEVPDGTRRRLEEVDKEQAPAASW
jgi:ADP-ribose pyrophosphatase YjhB (NUDIX family)